ncbi:MAG: hypothetical protein CVV21_11190 [Candidatus Goldiibacteriota bacterium HGW-Goldbacteria-1]|jgi:hypothetical protein|nr:MAG: hypothetical protein CVV21_11190 [Candidatus Goldiibacteriota bacterium HGW-Goldbacteria-1]
MKNRIIKISLIVIAAALIILLFLIKCDKNKFAPGKDIPEPIPAAGMYKTGDKASFILRDQIPGVKTKYSVFLLKTDFNGNQVWLKTYDAQKPRWAEAVFVSTDGSINILGRQYDTESGVSLPFLISCNDKGEIISEKEFGEDSIEINLEGGGALEAGAVKIPSQPDTGYYYEQVMPDKSLLQRYSGIKYFEWGNYGVIDPAGNIYELNGAEIPGAEFHEMSVTKRNEKGGTLWNFVYGGGYFERTYSICGGKNGGVIAAGVTESFGAGGSDAYLISVDAAGNCRWARSIGTDGDEAAYWIEKQGDNSIIAGVSCGVNNTCDIMVSLIDKAGTPRWIKYYDAGADEAAYYISKVKDGYLITGISGKF